jgi:hypothetical protein
LIRNAGSCHRMAATLPIEMGEETEVLLKRNRFLFSKE